MNEMQLKYGCNPNQKPSRVFMENGDLPQAVADTPQTGGRKQPKKQAK